MDEYHNKFLVYDDARTVGNHFHMWVKTPNGDAPVTIDGYSRENPLSATTAIRCEFTPQSPTDSGGFSFQNGYLPPTTTTVLPNFGEIPDAGYDLTGATALTFWARGEQGGEIITFFMGGTGWSPETEMPMEPYPDSTPLTTMSITLTTEWKKYTMSMSGKNLSYVLRGFGWDAQAAQNPEGATFYLDAIQYELDPIHLAQRLNTPRFIRSFTTTSELLTEEEDKEHNGPTLDNLAFAYDNALAILAFLADGSVDSLRRAQLIADAFVHVINHDVFLTFQDEREHPTYIRTIYMPGDLSLPPGWKLKGKPDRFAQGFFDRRTQQFIETKPQNIAVGNNSWTMIALLALYKSTGKTDYLETAKHIGEFILSLRNTDGLFQGFQGGLHISGKRPLIHRQWASTEHNLDVIAALSTLYNVTGETKWNEGAQHARQFVEHMYDSRIGCLLAGTLNPNVRNTQPGELPLDSQSWGILVLRDPPKRIASILRCAERNHHTTTDGFTGFDFNNDKDGVWFEGTAHMAVVYHLLNQPDKADTLRAELRRAQGMYAQRILNRRGLIAASHYGVSTGFGDSLFTHMHIGTTAWNIFAETGFNPFYDTARILPNIVSPANKADTSSTTDVSLPSDMSLENLPTVAFLNWPNHFQTNIEHFLVSVNAEPQSKVSIHNENTQTVDKSGIGMNVLKLEPGENIIEVHIESETDKTTRIQKHVIFNPKLNTSNRTLVYVDSVSRKAPGTIVLDHTNNVILGILFNKHIRGISPDGQYLYMHDRSVIQTIDHQETRSLINPLNFSENIPHNGFLVSPDGIHLYSRDEILDLKTNQILPATLPVNILTGVPFTNASIPGGPALSPDGQTLYAGPSTTPGNTVSIDLNSHVTFRMMDLESNSFQSDLAISPDERFLLRALYCCGNGVEILDTKTFKIRGPVKIGDFSGEINFSQDGRKVIVGSSGNPSLQGGGITVFDLETLNIDDHAVMGLADNLAVTPQNEIFVSSGEGAGIEVFHLNRYGRLFKIKRFFLGINQLISTLGIPRYDEIRRIIIKS